MDVYMGRWDVILLPSAAAFLHQWPDYPGILEPSMSRILLTTAILACLGGAAFSAETTTPPKHAAPVAANKLDPISGVAIDAKVKTVTVMVDGKEVIIGFASKEDADTVAKLDKKGKALYAQAATEGKLVKEGKLVDAPAEAPKADAAK